MPINARQKGKRGEREFRDVLRAAGYCKARRGQQFSGEQGNPDVICPELPSIHWEVKRCQASQPYKWLSQASYDGMSLVVNGTIVSRIPVVAHKQNGKQWIAILPMDDFLEIVRRSDLPSVNGKSDL
jgi:Holliday junction resolvase